MGVEATDMNVEEDCLSGIAEIDYSRDTLFGPIPMQATCSVELATVELNGQRLRELTIHGDVPDYLSKSTVVRVALEGKVEAGPVRERITDDGAGSNGLRLVFENEHHPTQH